MKQLILFAVFVCVVNSNPRILREENFRSFKSSFSKVYSSLSEEKQRLAVFSSNLKFIDNHNKLFDQKKTTFKLGVNQLTDLTFDEFIKYKTGLKVTKDVEIFLLTTTPATDLCRSTITTQKTTTTNNVQTTSTSGTKIFDSTTQPFGNSSVTLTTPLLPLNNTDSLDWRDYGFVGRVKDQGSCGSCWAFSANGALEGQWAKKTGVMVDLSEQNLIDCTYNREYGNSGCSGGNMEAAFKYVVKNKGINNQTIYPYKRFVSSCKYNSSFVEATGRNFSSVPKNEAILEKVLREVGPISVGINVNSYLQNYKSGIYLGSACSKSPNHGVLLVGFNNTNNPPYWIIKNSWGPKWGEQGYFRLQKGVNACGIISMASYPIV